MTQHETVKEALDRHGFGLVQVSGGKDSLATLHACKGEAHRIAAVLVDMGDAFPHVIKHVQDTCDEWGIKLYIVRSNVLEYVEQEGLPSDIVPVWAESLGRDLVPGNKGKQRLQSAFQCCRRMLWDPMNRFVIESGASLLIRGAKVNDEHVGVPHGTVENGIECCFPFWEATDEEVFAYLEEHDVALPFHYKLGFKHSLDCMQCTAWGNTDAESQRVRFTREYYPAEFAKLREKMLRVRETVTQEITNLMPFVEACTHE